jgi:hypothetical protein
MTNFPSDADHPDSPAQSRLRVVDLSAARTARRRHNDHDRPPWIDDALVDDRGRAIPILHNVAMALRAAPELADAFAFDELRRGVILERVLPLADGAEERSTAPVPRPLSDADASQVQEWLQSQCIRPSRCGRTSAPFTLFVTTSVA